MAGILTPPRDVGATSLLVGLALFVLASDQGSKYVVLRTLGGGGYVDLLGGAVRLDFTRNTGAAFGIYQSGGALLAAVAIAVVAGIVLFHRRIARSSLAVRTALGLVLGGALGNLVDRVRLGYVVDFVDLRWWPVFNLADSAIVLGVGILVVQSLLSGRESRAT